MVAINLHVHTFDTIELERQSGSSMPQFVDGYQDALPNQNRASPAPNLSAAADSFGSAPLLFKSVLSGSFQGRRRSTPSLQFFTHRIQGKTKSRSAIVGLSSDMHDTITVGAFASHLDGFGSGGVTAMRAAYRAKIDAELTRRELQAVRTDAAISSVHNASSAGPRGTENRTADTIGARGGVDEVTKSAELERLDIERRSEIIFSQALSALCTAFCARLVRLRRVPANLARIVQLGFLVRCEA